MSSFQALRAKRDARHAPLRHLAGSAGSGSAPGDDARASITSTQSAPPSVHPRSDLSESAGSASISNSTPALRPDPQAQPPTQPDPPQEAMQPDAVQPKEDHFLANARAQSVSELSPPDTAAFTAPSAPDQASVPDEAAGMLFGKELEGTPLEVRWCEGRGRGLYATKAVSAGTPLLQTPPLLALLSTSHLTTHCATCHRQTRVQRCAACKALHYCSPTCQKADWPSHKSECAALSRLRRMWAQTYPDNAKRGELGFVPHEGVRALARLCWARRAARVGGRDAAWWAQVAGMESHAKRGDGMMLGNQVQHLRMILGAAESSTGGGGGGEELLHPADMGAFGFGGAGELLDMASAFAVNSFTLSTPDLTPVGVATSPVCALFNHSCEPNAVVVFPRVRKGMSVVAIRDIKPGEEVLTAYIDVSLPYAERQSDLRDRYGFKCDCSLCVRDRTDWVNPRWSVLHPGCKQGGIGAMPDLGIHTDAGVKCTCGKTFVVNVPALRGNIEAGKRVLADDESGRLDNASALSTLSTLLPTLSALLPPSSHPLLQLLRLHALLLTPPAPSTRSTVLASLTAAAEGAKRAHPPNHPVVGVILAERAKIMAMPEAQQQDRVVLNHDSMRHTKDQLATAVVALREAVAACERGFGGGDVADEMRGLLRDCERELDMMRA